MVLWEWLQRRSTPGLRRPMDDDKLGRRRGLAGQCPREFAGEHNTGRTSKLPTHLGRTGPSLRGGWRIVLALTKNESHIEYFEALRRGHTPAILTDGPHTVAATTSAWSGRPHLGRHCNAAQEIYDTECTPSVLSCGEDSLGIVIGGPPEMGGVDEAAPRLGILAPVHEQEASVVSHTFSEGSRTRFEASAHQCVFGRATGYNEGTVSHRLYASPSVIHGISLKSQYVVRFGLIAYQRVHGAIAGKGFDGGAASPWLYISPPSARYSSPRDSRGWRRLRVSARAWYI